jgi:hypothetical protein
MEALNMPCQIGLFRKRSMASGTAVVPVLFMNSRAVRVQVESLVESKIAIFALVRLEVLVHSLVVRVGVRFLRKGYIAPRMRTAVHLGRPGRRTRIRMVAEPRRWVVLLLLRLLMVVGAAMRRRPERRRRQARRRRRWRRRRRAQPRHRR